jgi:WD40 repeat protein
MFYARSRTVLLAALAAACVLLVACAPTMPIDQDNSGGAVATFIAHRVIGAPGTVAWSPEGKYLAFLTRKTQKVTIYDPVSGESFTFESKRPFFLSWADQLTLLIAHGSSDSPVLTLLDIPSKKTVRYPLPPNTVALFGEPGAHYGWAFVEENEWRGIGIDYRYALFRPDWKKNTIGEIAKKSRIIAIREQVLPYLRGWATVGPDPVTGKAVLLLLITPTRGPVFLRAIAIDTVTLEQTGIANIPLNEWITTGASWSPDGKRLAFTGNDGRLKVLSMDGSLTTLDKEVIGTYPAWDPRGGQIFFGGFLIADDSSDRTRLVSGKGKETSTAFFSPAGDHMALDVKGNLWLISGIAPSPRAPKTPPSVLQKKASALRALYRDGSITREEYRKRLKVLLQEFGKN